MLIFFEKFGSHPVSSRGVELAWEFLLGGGAPRVAVWGGSVRSVSDEAPVFAFRMWWRAGDFAEWLPGARLLVHVADGHSVVPEQLSWVTEDGAQSAVGFSPERASCYGHRRTADGGLVQVRGELDGQWDYPEGADGARGYEFDTQAEDTGGWHPAGRLRLLIDDGDKAPLRWVAWHDRLGNACSVALRSVSPSGNADVTDLVSVVWASAEYRDAGEVAANLLDRSSSKWFAPHSGASLEFQLTQPAVVERYALTSADDAPDRDPTAWTLRGSTDGHWWRTLDARTGQSFAGRHQSRLYRIAEGGAYDHYRLDITGNNGSPHLQLASVRFLVSGSGGFVGYRQRAGHAPAAYRGIRIAQESPDPSTAPLYEELPTRPAVPAGTPRLPAVPSVPLVRTDFSDDNAWAATCAQVTAPRHHGHDTYYAYVEPVDDVEFEGLTAAQLVPLVPPGVDWSLLLVADTTTMQSSEHHVMVVGLDDDSYGRTFRATAPAVGEAENNLSVGNMEFEDFEDSADDDGVVRPMLAYDPAPLADE